MTGVYKIGILTDPRPDDAEVYEVEDAEAVAYEMCNKDPNAPIAIWDSGDEVVTLYLNGDQFKLA